MLEFGIEKYAISFNFCFKSSSVTWNVANPAASNANAYVFLCSQNDQGGVVGIAWVDGTCDSTKGYRSSINEYLRNDVVTASVRFLNQT